MSEKINHPRYYTHPGRKECIVEMEEKYGPEVTAIFCLTNACKYLYRRGEKANNPMHQDTNKAEWYFNYCNNLIDKYGILMINGTRIEDTDLYLDIKECVENE